MAIPTHLTNFLQSRPNIRVIARSDDDFDQIKKGFVDSPDVPLVILRPRTADDVAAAVSHLSANSTPLVIRAGGHDLSARSIADNAVQIDLRDLASVQVAEDKSTARIGGGVLTQHLLDALAAEQVMTACGNSGSVGWCSWAMNGGYGIIAGHYGLGCDQILAARVVLADGSLVDADERLLKALRGCGPAFGVIVELTIQLYPLTEITGGIITCDGTDLESSLTKYFDNCRSLFSSDEAVPSQLYFQPMIMTPPGAPGPGFVVQFIWAGPSSEEQAKWLEKIVSICPGGQPAVASAPLADYIRQFTQMVPPHVLYGESRTVSMRTLLPSPAAAAVIAKSAPRVTPGWGAMFIHMIHGQSVSSERNHPASVFASREVHLMVEILGFAFVDPEGMEQAAEWCKTTQEALLAADGSMDKVYFPLTSKSAFSLERTYNTAELEFLRELKKEVDPKNVFFNPMPIGA